MMDEKTIAIAKQIIAWQLELNFWSSAIESSGFIKIESDLIGNFRLLEYALNLLEFPNDEGSLEFAINSFFDISNSQRSVEE